MDDYIEERVIKVANYIIETRCTCREAAKKFGIGKTTIHKDMDYRLPIIDKKLYKQVRYIFDINKQEAHLRGGIATIEKYLLMNS